MNTSSGRGRRRLARSLVAVGALAAVVVPASPASAATNIGAFNTLQAGTDMGLQIHGMAVLTRSSAGTKAMVVLLGLDPGATYGAHLHKESCAAANPGGGHYMNVDGAGTTPPNELWFSSTADPAAGIRAGRSGLGIGRGTATWVARPEARAVVIHAIPAGGNPSGGPKIACADLR